MTANEKKSLEINSALAEATARFERELSEETYFEYQQLRQKKLELEGNKRKPLTISIDNELGDQIIAEWLLRHIEYAGESYSNAVNADDVADAAADLLSLRRIYRYVTGEEAP